MMNDSYAALPRFDPYSFGKRLQSARKVLGITQEDLAERLHVDRNHISRMERGISACSVDLLVEMAWVLDVSTDYLLAWNSSNATIKRELCIAIEQLSRIAQKL